MSAANTVKAQFVRFVEAKKALDVAEQGLSAVEALKAEVEAAREEARQAFGIADDAFNSAMGLHELKDAESRRSAAQADIARADSLLAKFAERLERAGEAVRGARMELTDIKSRVIPTAIQEEAVAAIKGQRDKAYLRLLACGYLLGQRVTPEVFGAGAVKEMAMEINREIEEAR